VPLFYLAQIVPMVLAFMALTGRLGRWRSRRRPLVAQASRNEVARA
jgi:hypothetical protein